MKTLSATGLLLILAGAVAPAATLAQSSSSSGSGINFFIAQRAWFVTWDAPALTSHIVAPGGGAEPAIQTGYTNQVTSAVLSVTTIGARKGPLSLSASYSPSRSFKNDRLVGGNASREEYDLSLGYAVTPNVGMAFIYKGARADAGTHVDAIGVEDFANRQRYQMYLLGVSANAAIGERLSAYANFAYGPGRATVTGDKSDVGTPRVSLRYTIADIGISYPIPNVAFGSLSILAGFRIQTVSFPRVESFTIRTTDYDTQTRKLQTTTQGVSLGVSLGF